MGPLGKEHMTNGKKLLGAGVVTFLVVTTGSIALANGTNAREAIVAEESVVEQPSPPSDQYIIDVQVSELNNFLAEQHRIEAEKEAAAKAAAATARQATSSQAGVYTESSPNDFLACVKQRESGGDYGALNRGSSAGGAYQMLMSTANTVANWMERPDLVGIGAQNWSPADQDAGALILFERMGKSPWYYPPKPC